MNPRAADYVNLLNRRREGAELRQAAAEAEAEALVHIMTDREFTTAQRMLKEHERVNPSPPGHRGGWDGRFHRAPYTDDGERRLAEGRFPKWLRGTIIS